MKKVKSVGLLIIAMLFGTMHSFSQDGALILKKMDDVLSAPKDRTGTIEIVLISKSGKEKVREAEMMQKGRDKKIYRYTKPESQAGIATLSLPGGIMWLYMPALGKPKKISVGSRMSILRLSFGQNPYVGAFVRATDKFALIPDTVPAPTVEKIKETLKVDTYKLTLDGSRLLGVFLAANSKGLLVPHFVDDKQISIYSFM